MYLPPRAKYFRENSLISPQQRRLKGSGTITGTKCQSAKYSRPPPPTHTPPTTGRCKLSKVAQKDLKKGDHIKISTSWRRLSCPCTINSSPVCGWVGRSGWHPLWTRLTPTTWYHIGNISRIRSSQCPGSLPIFIIFTLPCNLLRTRALFFFNPIDPRHFVLVVHLKISLGNEPAIGARQLCGELGICGYFKVILAKAGGNSDVTLWFGQSVAFIWFRDRCDDRQ